MRNILSLLLLFIAGFAPGSSHGQDASAARPVGTAPDSDAAVLVRMEGEAHRLRKLNKRESTVTFAEGRIRFYLVENENPVTLNFNLSNTDVLETGSAVYMLPEANHGNAVRGNAVIDLNFFNRNRSSRRTQRRIVFNEGTIEIEVLTRNRLKMNFKGSGHPLTDRKNRFPIEGSVDVVF